MDKINGAVKSESLSCYSTGHDKIIPRDRTKMFSNTKSRLLVHYNDERIYKENARIQGLYRNYNQSAAPSTTTLNPFPQQRMLEQNQSAKASSREFLPPKNSEQTIYNQPFDVERFRRHSNGEVSTSGLRKSTRTERKSGHSKKDFSIGLSLHGSNKIDVLTGGYYRAVCESSTSSGARNFTSPKEVLSLRGHSFTRQNQGNENADTEKELLRARRNSVLAKQSSDEQSCALNESLPPNEIQNEAKSFTLYNGHSDSNIDFQSMKQSLQNPSSPVKKFDLVQSLVLRLSNQDPDERSTTVQAIVDNDLLNLNGDSGNSNTLEDLLWPVNITTPHPLQTSVAKLLNALSSFEVGRDYFSKISMVKLLTWKGSEQIYDSMADNLMATLKKLSLNKFQRRDMLEKGLLQWLINHMEMVEHSASMVRMECMTDLLRMLMSVENSTECAFVNVPHLIVVLVRYLNVANEYVQVNVGHVLRSLFLNDSAIEIGNKINLHRIIRDLFKNASNSKLKADLRFIYELFIKHRACSSNRPASSASSVSRSAGSERAISAGGQDLNNDIDNQNEQLICEQSLMQETEIIADANEVQTEDNENMQLSVKPKHSFPPDLRSYIVQLCLDTNTSETGSKTSDGERNDQSLTVNSNPGTAILFSNINSRLEQSSSLLSSGSQCASSACKESAIQTLKMKSIRTDSAIEMDQETQNLAATSSSKFHSQKMYKNTSSKVLTDYSDLSSIAKDRDARNEILENESFIDELCEKVFKKLRSKLAQNFFCGPNCNTNPNCGDCTKVEANV